MAYDFKRYFGEIDVLRDITTMPGEANWRTAPPPREGEHHQIVLYLGCNVFRTSHMIRTITAIFDRLGLDYVAVGGPTYCCGIVHHQQGHTVAAGGMADNTIKLFERYRPEEVVMWCPSCIYFYDEVRHAKLPFKVSHAAEFLVSKLPEIPLTERVRSTVALHYHNVSEPRQREGQAGRQLLEAVPELRYVEVEPNPYFGRSCTPAIQQQLGLDAWNAMGLDEVDRARAAGAETLATICPLLSAPACASSRWSRSRSSTISRSRPRARHRVRRQVQEISTVDPKRVAAEDYALPARTTSMSRGPARS